MKKPIQRVFLLVVGFIVILSMGCQPAGRLSAEQQLASEKKNRLIAAENYQLKKKLRQLDKDIQKLKRQHEEEIKRQKELLAKCQKQKKALEEKLHENVEEQVDDVLSAVVNENEKLRNEIERILTLGHKYIRTQAPAVTSPDRHKPRP